MDQYNKAQYDDDLTLGTEEYDDTYYTDADDLFEFASDDQSPMSRLRSLVLSIDWEITDEVLTQFNEELIDLKDIWAGEKINLVYVQALEKISKYIYQKKADAHPNAIKLLLSLYYNLEKIVSDHTLTSEERKRVLAEDVKRFENLKKVIGQRSETEKAETGKKSSADTMVAKKASEQQKSDTSEILLRLKAIVLAIDWEITDQELNDLRAEVIRLENHFAGNKPRLILLQGIGTLGAYIKLKKSNAHADAFKVLHLFYETLEKIVTEPMTVEEEKALLLPAVDKFTSFKKVLGPSLDTDAPEEEDEDEDEDDFKGGGGNGSLMPALADVPEDEGIGFQAEKEMAVLDPNGIGLVAEKLDNFFTEAPAGVDAEPAASEVEEKISELENEFLAGLPNEDSANSVDVTPVAAELALQGVDVEMDDEEDEEIASSLSSLFGDEDVPAPAPTQTIEQPKKPEVAREIEIEPPVFASIDPEVALQGVAVETEADDDSDLEDLPMEGGHLAPALVEMEDDTLAISEVMAEAQANVDEDKFAEEVGGKLDNFFGELEESSPVIQTSPGPDEEMLKLDEELVVEADGEPELADEPIASIGFVQEIIPTTEKPVIEQEVISTIEDVPEEEISTLLDQPHGDEEQEFLVEIEESPGVLGSEEDKDFSIEDEIDSLLAEPEAQEEVQSSRAQDEAFPEFFEEDVVFELAEVEEKGLGEAVEPMIPVSTEIQDETGKAEPIISGDSLVFAEETAKQDETDLLEVGATFAEESTEGSFEEPELEVEGSGDDLLQPLRFCIESVGYEINDSIIAGFRHELNELAQKYTDKPLGQTFLKLISTVVEHIAQYRNEADVESFNILKSVCNGLELAEANVEDLKSNQQILLQETSKVLEWQQAMLNRRPVEAVTSGIPENHEELTLQSNSQEPIVELSESVSSEHESATELKVEFDKLRLALREEIAQLRKELFSK